MYDYSSTRLLLLPWLTIQLLWIKSNSCEGRWKEKQNKTKQNKTKQNKTKQNKTKQNKQNKTKQKFECHFLLLQPSYVSDEVFLHIPVQECTFLGTASKPDPRLTGGSVRFRPVSVVLNNGNRPEPGRTAGQPVVRFWSHPLINWLYKHNAAFFFCFVLHSFSTLTFFNYISHQNSL